MWRVRLPVREQRDSVTSRLRSHPSDRGVRVVELGEVEDAGDGDAAEGEQGDEQPE